MGTLNDFHPGLSVYFPDNCIFVRAMIRNAWSDMHFGHVLINRLVPEVDLRKPCNNGCTRTVSAVNKPYQFSIIAAVTFKFAGPSVKADHTA